MRTFKQPKVNGWDNFEVSVLEALGRLWLLEMRHVCGQDMGGESIEYTCGSIMPYNYRTKRTGKKLTIEEAKAVYKKLKGRNERKAWWGVLRNMEGFEYKKPRCHVCNSPLEKEDKGTVCNECRSVRRMAY